MSDKKWAVVGRTMRLGETGDDADFQWEVSNGAELLFVGEDVEEAPLQAIVGILNEHEIDLRADDSNEFVLYHEKKDVIAERDTLKKQNAILVEAVKDYADPAHWAIWRSIGSVNGFAVRYKPDDTTNHGYTVAQKALEEIGK